VTFDPASPASPAPTPRQVGGGGIVYGIACPTATQCTAVGLAGVSTFDPTSTTGVTPAVLDGTDDLQAIACPTATSCTAVDNAGRQLTFAPAAPAGASPLTVDDGADLRGIACPAAATCTAVDTTGHEVTFDPSSQALPGALAVAGGQPLSGIACASAGECVAVGDSEAVAGDPAATVASAWTAAAVTRVNHLSAVTCPTGTECVAVDTSGHESTGAVQPPAEVTPPANAGGPCARSKVRAALRRVLAPKGRHARIARLVRSRRFRFRFAAPCAGKLVVRWDHRRRPRLVASARATFTRARTRRVAIRLTAAGRALLRRSRRVRLTATATFTPRGAKAVTVRRRFTLRR
jgi:hypothetical protein